MRGGERVLEQVLRMFPEADIYTHVYNPDGVSDLIRSRTIKTTFINKLPASRKFYQHYLPLMPVALEELDLSGYDLVISFEAGPAKGVITSPHALHVCYCHSPMRYIWDSYGEYKSASGFLSRTLMPAIFHYLRIWDVTNSARVDGFMANSTFIQRRIEKFYRRESKVIAPPVQVSLFKQNATPEDFYLWVGHMTAYKRPDLAVEAFNKNGLPLVMVGDGPLYDEMKKLASSNITIISKLNYSEFRDMYARSRALIYTAEEDFGIIPVESLAAGRPVIAFGRGGVLDTLDDGVTAILFPEQTVSSLMDGIERFNSWLPSFRPEDAVASAARFSPENFDQKFREAIEYYNGGRHDLINKWLLHNG